MRTSIFCLVALLGTAVVSLGACSPTAAGLGGTCEGDGDCTGGLVCGPDRRCVAGPDGGGNSNSNDAAVGNDAGLCDDGRPECAGQCCGPTTTCVDDRCFEPDACGEDRDCQEDSYCHEGECIPYGEGPRGELNGECASFSMAGLFQPTMECEFIAAPAGDPYPNHVRVLSTPLVVDFDFDDMATVRSPSLVVMTYNGDDGSSGYWGGAYGVIRVLDGATCELRYNVGDQLNGCNTPALADLDGDGRPEIVAHTGVGGIVAYRYDPGTDAFVQHCAGSLTFAAQATGWAGPSVHDLDDDGVPEIMSGGITYDANCAVVDQSLGLTTYMYRGAGYPVVADLDGELDADGIPSVELATGNAVFRFDRLSQSWVNVWSGGPPAGFIAVADFGTFGSNPAQDNRLVADGVAEVVIVAAPNVYVTTWEGRVIYGPVPMPSGAGGGPPTVGDFDGDGLVEVACSGSDSIAVFDPDCRGLPDLLRCNSLRTDGILWWQPSQDLSSNITGSSLFDFEGDGRVEVVYADEVFLRVYDGQSGEVIFSQWHSSCTWNEYPVVADVDGDYNAEIVMPSNENCTIAPSSAGGVPYPMGPNGFPLDPLFKGLRCQGATDCASASCDAGYCRCASDADCGGTGSGFVCANPIAGTPGSGDTCRSEWRGAYNGVRVYGDVLDRWVSSRTIWSQHAYAVTHISEGGEVRQTSNWTANWLTPGMNHFRQNTQGGSGANDAPDMTGKRGLLTCGPTGTATLEVRVCNRGTQPVGQGVPVAFYSGAPADGVLACQATTSAEILPGNCLSVSCLWPTAPMAPELAVEVTVVVDDDGTGVGANSECLEGNNQAFIPDVWCLPVG